MGTEFGKRLRLARQHAEMKQMDAARAIGISQGSLSELEREGFGSSYTTAFAKLYGCDAHWLATGDGEPNWRDEADRSEQAWVAAFREIPAGFRLQLLEEVRRRARELRAAPGLPVELAAIKAELDVMTPEERASALARAMQAISGQSAHEMELETLEPEPATRQPGARPRRTRAPHR